MTGRTHDLAAFTALSYLVVQYPPHTITLSTALVAILANLMGGIAPDIDQPTAPLWRNLPIGGFFGRMFDPLLGGHRFISHSIAGAVLFGVGWYYLLSVLKPSFPHLNMDILWWSFMIGVVSHLLMDTLTREGVPWFLPFPWKIGLPPGKDLRIVTGGFRERFLIFPALLLATLYIYYTHYPFFLQIFKHLIK